MFSRNDKVSAHFTRAEFACKCGCGFDAVDIELLAVLERIREHYKCPVHINSGCRCVKHNHAVGGKADSDHIKGKAADIVVEGVQPDEVFVIIDSWYPDCLGLGKYVTFTHIGIRGAKSRWTLN